MIVYELYMLLYMILSFSHTEIYRKHTRDIGIQPIRSTSKPYENAAKIIPDTFSAKKWSWK